MKTLVLGSKMRTIDMHSGEVTIPEYLITAYQGHFGTDDQDLDRDSAIEKIMAASSKERLKVYLQWNGIIGYTSQIFTIAHEDWRGK